MTLFMELGSGTSNQTFYPVLEKKSLNGSLNDNDVITAKDLEASFGTPIGQNRKLPFLGFMTFIFFCFMLRSHTLANETFHT